MLLHWAIFGERGGGHALLATSGNDRVAARFTQFTDRPGDPPSTLSWGPADSGFMLGEHYALLRTLPDTTAGRAGMVRSYLVLVPLGDLPEVGSLGPIFDLLPSQVVAAPSKIPPLAIPNDRLTATKTAATAVQAQIARRLCDSQATLPILWPLTEPYLPTVDAIWGRLPSSLKPSFAFAFQFAPEHKLPIKPVFVATPVELVSRWPRLHLIAPGDAPTNLTAAERMLAGAPSAFDLAQILADHSIRVPAFERLALLSVFAELIQRLPELTFAEARRALNILAHNSALATPSEARAALSKRLCELLVGASAEDVMSLRNLNADALADILPPIAAQLGVRAFALATHGKLTASEVELLGYAVASPTNWWSQPFVRWLTDYVALSAPRVLFELAGHAHIFEVIKSALPVHETTESSLLLGLPPTLSGTTLDTLLGLCEERRWTRLHGLSLVRAYTPQEALLKHVSAAGHSTASLDAMMDAVGFDAIATTAVSTGVDALVQFVASKLATAGDSSNRTLPSGGFRNVVLCRALEVQITPVRGHLRQLIEAALVEFEFREQPDEGMANLCMACIRNDATLFLNTKPTELFRVLDAEQQIQCIQALNVSLQREVLFGNVVRIDDPNSFRNILDRHSLLQALSDVPPANLAQTGVRVFRTFTFLSDVDCRSWLVDLFTRTHHIGISTADASAIADLLLAADYPSTARVVRETVEEYGRGDAAPIHNAIRYKYQMAKAYRRDRAARPNNLPKVLIATALPLERDEVIAHLTNATYDPELLADVAAWPADDPAFEVYVLVTGAGNLNSQSGVLGAVADAKPDIAFFVGVCGALKDSNIGDVVYSTKVYHYEGGKEETDGFKARPATEETSEHLVQLAHRVARTAWQPTPVDADSLPKASAAVMASGEVVLASTDSTARNYQLLKSSYNDTHVVDMEAYGFLRSLRKGNVDDGMVIRGVSDRLKDKAESDAHGNQPLAARNAAAFLFAMLSSCRRGKRAPKRLRKKGFIKRIFSSDDD